MAHGVTWWRRITGDAGAAAVCDTQEYDPGASDHGGRVEAHCLATSPPCDGEYGAIRRCSRPSRVTRAPRRRAVRLAADPGLAMPEDMAADRRGQGKAIADREVNVLGRQSALGL